MFGGESNFLSWPDVYRKKLSISLLLPNWFYFVDFDELNTKK